MSPSFYMQLALNEAWKYQGLTYPNPAVGCVILGEYNEILSIEAHHKAGESHAELNASISAFKKLSSIDISHLNAIDAHAYLLKNHNKLFTKTTFFVTLEPCSHSGKTPSCATLLKILKPKKIYVSQNDKSLKACGGNQILKDIGIDVESAILKDKGYDLLYPFLKSSKDSFVFFKWAQRLDGSVSGGVISSNESRTLVHKMRDVCDLLVIGGNTVRVDRPTLDARMVDGKAPDILIYSKSDDFDRDIPLFKLKNRDVFVSSSLEKISDYKNVMIEGGASMLDATKDIVDYYLCFINPSVSSTNIKHNKINFEILHNFRVGTDIAMWMKRK